MQTEKPKKRGRETKLLSLVALPILATIVVTQTEGVYNDRLFIDTYNDWTMPEKMIKDLCMNPSFLNPLYPVLIKHFLNLYAHQGYPSTQLDFWSGVGAQ